VTKTITCKCDNQMDVEIPETVDVSAEPEQVERILDGSFLTFTCDSCGTTVKPEIPIRLVWPAKDTDIFFVPELERSAYLRGKRRYPEAKRVVIGYPELVEKIRILQDSLDDRVVELLKYRLLQKAPPSAEIAIHYRGREDDALVFYVYGLRQDEVGVSKVPWSAYERQEAELPEALGEKGFSDFLSPPYVSVNTITREDG
jgi:hypothetical protein